MMCAGPKHTQNHIRTVFEDCEHGSEMQISTILLNLHEVAWVLRVSIDLRPCVYNETLNTLFLDNFANHSMTNVKENVPVQPF